jgi:hypothetical protein
MPSAPLIAEITSNRRGSSSPPSNGSAGLRAVGLKEEKGVLKAVYDPEDLRRYREEHGIVIANQDSGPSSPSATRESGGERYDGRFQNQDGHGSGDGITEEDVIPRPHSSPHAEHMVHYLSERAPYPGPGRRGSLAPTRGPGPGPAPTQYQARPPASVLTPVPIPFTNPIINANDYSSPPPPGPGPGGLTFSIPVGPPPGHHPLHETPYAHSSTSRSFDRVQYRNQNQNQDGYQYTQGERFHPYGPVGGQQFMSSGPGW